MGQGRWRWGSLASPSWLPGKPPIMTMTPREPSVQAAQREPSSWGRGWLARTGKALRAGQPPPRSAGGPTLDADWK